MLTLSEENLGKHKSQRVNKTRTLEKCEATVIYNYSKHKYRQTLSQIKINLQVTGLFTSVPITQYIMSGFQQKVTRHAKSQEIIESEETK